MFRRQMGGDDMNQQKKLNKGLIIVSVFCGLFFVNQTQAWLLAKTSERQNKFVIGQVTHEIEEEFDQTLKTNVTVKNTGTTSAFIRVKLIPQWLDETGKTVLGLEATDTFESQLNEVDWFQQDGFWYYRQAVPSGGETAVLVKSAKSKEQLAEEYAGKVFNLQVLSQSVQSEPAAAVTELWGIDPSVP